MGDFGFNVLFLGNNFLRLLEGLWVTIRISLVSAALSVPLGVLFGLLMTVKNPVISAICRAYSHFVRIMPQLVLLFVAYFGISRAFGLDISAESSAIGVFTLWGTAELGDLVRGAIGGIPKGQYESAAALGMNGRQTLLYVIFPQTLRRLLPPAINLVTRMIKTTSLVALIGMTEVLKVGKQIIDANRFDYPTSALWVYGVIFFLYFIVCRVISMFSARLDRRWR